MSFWYNNLFLHHSLMLFGSRKDRRESRLPLKLWEYMMYKQFGMLDGQEILDHFGCREKCGLSKSDIFDLTRRDNKCDCGDEAVDWLSSWIWSCHLRAGIT